MLQGNKPKSVVSFDDLTLKKRIPLASKLLALFKRIAVLHCCIGRTYQTRLQVSTVRQYRFSKKCWNINPHPAGGGGPKGPPVVFRK